MKTIRDPIHSNILLDDLALDLINTPEFQRLRRIKQLGYVNLLYPGANHTRFEHSLGTYHLAVQSMNLFRSKKWISKERIAEVKAAALLHDLGHGPFSHISEEILNDLKGITHEDLTKELVLSSSIGDILSSHGIDPLRVAKLIEGKGKYGALIAGDLDVDRMDYLMRDAHYTGVKISADPARIVSKMDFKDNLLVIHENGLASAEGLLLARFLMYPTIYMHHTCRSAGVMLKHAILDALESNYLTLEELQRMDDHELINRLKDSAPYAEEMISLIDSRRLFKRAYTGSVKKLDLAGKDLKKKRKRLAIQRKLIKKSYPYLTEGYLFLEVPPPPVLEEANAKVWLENGEVKPIAEVSSLVKGLKQAQLDHWKFWVFVPSKYLDKVKPIVKRYFGG
jgi:hypothetical protein